MENEEAKLPQNSPQKTQKLFLGTQVLLRFLAVSTTLAATWIMLTSKQSILLYGIQLDARYSYSSAFQFFTFANIVVCAFSLLSMFYVLVIARGGFNPAYYFFLFLHDLCMMSLLLAGCAAGTAIGYVGKYGNSHSGWLPICDHFGKFCNKITTSLILSYLSVLCYQALTITSASRSREIQF